MSVSGVEPAKLAYMVFVDSVRKGFPAEYRVLGRDAVLVRNDKGMGVVYARVIDGGHGGMYVEASADKYSIWYVRLGRVDGGRITEEYLHAVPVVLSQHQHLISTFEADVWVRRLSMLDRLRPAGEVPAALAPYRVLGAKIMYLPDTEDYAAVKGDVVLAWYNKLTGRLDDAYRYLARMRLL